MSASTTDLVLFAHGSRDPVWAEPLHRVRALIGAQAGPSVNVHLAFLELMAPTLPDLIGTLAARNVQDVHIVPMFLGRGTHARNDLPALLDQLRANYPQMTITCQMAIGDDDRVLKSIAATCLDGLLRRS